MVGESDANKREFTTAADAGDAVGVPPGKWYVAVVSNNTEKTCGAKLLQLGYDVYVPLQKEMHRWKNGRRKIIDRVVIPSKVFIRCTEMERRKHVVALPFVKRFMTDRAAMVNEFGFHPVAVIPDAQIQKLRFILFNSNTAVTVEPLPLRLGDKVRVIRGNLMGIEGNIVRCDGSVKDDSGDLDIVVQLDILGCARMSISRNDLERI